MRTAEPESSPTIVACAYDFEAGRVAPTLHEAELEANGVDVAALRTAIDARPPRSRQAGTIAARNARWRATDDHDARQPSDAPAADGEHVHDGCTQPLPLTRLAQSSREATPDAAHIGPCA